MNHTLVCGRNAVLECLRVKRRRAHRLYILDSGRGLEDLVAAAGSLPISQCRREDLDKRAKGVAHQGVILEADELPILGDDEWPGAKLPERPLVLLLDGVQDPQNFGSIIRSGMAFGVHAFIFPKDRAAPLTPSAVKAAAGAAEHATFVRVTNLSRTMDALKARGIWIGGLDPDGGEAPWACDFRGPIGLVIGGEGKGMRPLVRKHCDYIVTLPLTGAVESLNAGVAAAVVLGEVTRQRTMTKKTH